MAIDRALAHPRVAGDLGEAEVLEAAGFQLAAHGAQDLLARLLPLAVPEIRQGGFHGSRTVMSLIAKSTHRGVTSNCHEAARLAPNPRAIGHAGASGSACGYVCSGMTGPHIARGVREQALPRAFDGSPEPTKAQSFAKN